MSPTEDAPIVRFRSSSCSTTLDFIHPLSTDQSHDGFFFSAHFQKEYDEERSIYTPSTNVVRCVNKMQKAPVLQVQNTLASVNQTLIRLKLNTKLSESFRLAKIRPTIFSHRPQNWYSSIKLNICANFLLVFCFLLFVSTNTKSRSSFNWSDDSFSP